MYCEKCGQEIEPSEICPKCGCLSGYVDVQKISNQQREKVKNLPVIIISLVGIALLVFSLFFNDLPVVKALPRLIFTYPLVDIAGIAAFISLMVRKFEKIKLLYPILLILKTVFSICHHDVTIVFIIASIMLIFSMIAEIIFMCRKTKSICIISIIALAINIAINIILAVISMIMNEFFGIDFFVIDILRFRSNPALLFVIANFLYINNKNKIENEKALL